MNDKPGPVSPESSETDPPAANQPLDGGGPEAERTPAASGKPPSADPTVPEAPQVVPGKPDGEVDTGA
jgi:hypothetical protein